MRSEPSPRPDDIQFADRDAQDPQRQDQRRVLRKIASGQAEELGDVSTLADPSVVGKLVEDHRLQAKK